MTDPGTTDITIRQEMTLKQFLISAVKSNLFGAKSSEQAGMQVMAGLEYGFGPVTSLSNIHIIDGKPSIGAHLLAAMIRKHPRYDYKIKKMDNESCVLVPIIDGEDQGPCSFSMEDAEIAGLIRPNSPWQKYPRNMLFARCISNVHAWYMPDAMGEGGRVFTPEELGDEDEGHNGPAIAVEAEVEPSGKAVEEAKPRNRPLAEDLDAALAPFDPQEAPQEPADGAQPTLEVYRGLCGLYKATLGEDVYYKDLGCKSNEVPADERAGALNDLHHCATQRRPEGAPWPSPEALAEAVGMKRDDLLEGITTMEGTDVANWGAYLSKPAEKALVSELRVYHARLADMAWAAAPKDVERG